MIFPFKPDRVFLWSPSPERCTCPEAVAFWEQKDREAEEQKQAEERSKQLHDIIPIVNNLI